jgi:hypothetical protein
MRAHDRLRKAIREPELAWTGRRQTRNDRMGAQRPYPVDLVARTLLALLHETSAEVARSKHDPKIRAQISDLVAGVLDVFLVR